MSIRVGIVGISGFGGGEAMRLVASHPSFELIYAAGEGSAGSRLVERFPGVPARLAELVIEKWDPVTLPKLDVLFASLPTGASAESLARLPKDVKIVDIGGDHRYVEGSTSGQPRSRARAASLLPRATTGQCLDAARRFYAGAAFVRVTDKPPQTKWATGSNLASAA